MTKSISRKLGIALLIMVTAFACNLIAAEEKAADEKAVSPDAKSAVQPSKESKESKVLATVNGVAIKEDEVDLLFEHLEGRMPRSHILNQLIQKKAIEQFLDKEKFTIEEKLVDDEIALITDVYAKRNIDLKAKMKEQQISEEEFKREIKFQVRLREYLEGKTTDNEVMDGLSGVRASHILIATAEIKEEDAEKKIKEIEEGLRKSENLKEAFAEAAGKYSDCPSKAKGGDLGVFKRGTMVKEFSDVAFSLEVGQMSPPVKTKFGYHLILVTERNPLDKDKYEKDKEKFKAQYVQMKTLQFVADTTEKAEVERFDTFELPNSKPGVDKKTGDEKENKPDEKPVIKDSKTDADDGK